MGPLPVRITRGRSELAVGACGRLLPAVLCPARAALVCSTAACVIVAETAASTSTNAAMESGNLLRGRLCLLSKTLLSDRASAGVTPRS